MEDEARREGLAELDRFLLLAHGDDFLEKADVGFRNGRLFQPVDEGPAHPVIHVALPVSRQAGHSGQG